jgi:hypothetical protein
VKKDFDCAVAVTTSPDSRQSNEALIAKKTSKTRHINLREEV